MDIIIVGCGKVGSALAEVLSEEHNVTVIDKNEEVIDSIVNDLDVMGIAGNCLQEDESAPLCCPCQKSRI